MDKIMNKLGRRKSKRKELGESNKFSCFEKILTDFTKIIKENLCGLQMIKLKKKKSFMRYTKLNYGCVKSSPLHFFHIRIFLSSTRPPRKFSKFYFSISV